MAPSTSESSSSACKANLTDDDVDRYRTLKQRLNAAEEKQARHLWEIKSESLYLVEYDTFREFVEREVGYSRRQADRLANWGRILSVVSSGGPACEGQARPFSSIKDADDVRLIWRRALELVDDRGSSMTAALVREARGSVLAGKSENASRDASDGNARNGTQSVPSSSGSFNKPQSGNEQRSGDGMDNLPDQERDLAAAETDNCNSDQDSPSDEEDHEEQANKTVDASKNASSTPLTDSKVSVAVPEAVADEHGLDHMAECQDRQRDLQIPLDDIGLKKLLTLVEEMSPERAPPLAKSIPVADGFTFPLEGPTEPKKSISDPNDALGQPDTLRLRALVQIQGKTGRDATCKMLLSPGLDLFAPAVPGGLQQVVLKACRDIEPTALLTTDHPSEVPGSNVPESVWIGSRASFSTLKETEKQLEEADLTSAWIRLNLDKGDVQTELPLAEDSPIDWLICQGPEEPVRKEAYDQFLQSAGGAGTELFFLDPVSVVHRAHPRLGEDARDV